MRYGFNHGLVPLEELMWHFYAVAFMFGMAYAITKDTHIRVDLVHMKLPRPAPQHIIEILGILLLLMPFLWIIFHHSLEWVAESYRLDESPQTPGLPHRWIIKSVIPLSSSSCSSPRWLA